MGLSVKTQGKKGGELSSIKEVGRTVVFVDTYHNHIEVGGYEGKGEGYQKRDKCKVVISKDGNTWEGTFNELFERLF